MPSLGKPPEEHPDGSISEYMAEAQRSLLYLVFQVLDMDGVNAQLITSAHIAASSEKSGKSIERRWDPPLLVIYTDDGWRIATVSIGAKSAAYCLQLAQTGPGGLPLADRVEVSSKLTRVARLIAQNKKYQHDLPNGR